MTKYFFNEGGKMQKFKGILKNMLTVLIFGAMATGICLAFSAWNFPETNLVVVYILSVLLVARLPIRKLCHSDYHKQLLYHQNAYPRPF